MNDTPTDQASDSLVGAPVRWNFGPIVGHIIAAEKSHRKTRVTIEIDPKWRNLRKFVTDVDFKHFSVAGPDDKQPQQDRIDEVEEKMKAL